MKILTLTKLPEEQVTALNNAGYEVIHAAIRDLSDAELVDIDIIYGVDEFLNDILLHILELPNHKLKWLQVVSAGVNYLPLKELQAAGVQITNASGVKAKPIAQTVLAFLLSFARSVNTYEHIHTWNEQTDQYLIDELHIAVFGTGNIGKQVATYLNAFGADVIGISRSGRTSPEFMANYKIDDAPDALAKHKIDVVINTLPGTDETRHYFDDAFFTAQPLFAFINVGRGSTVAQRDLIAALKNGQVRFAGLDVTSPEPLPDDNALWTFENVILTQHTSWGEHANKGRRFGKTDLFDIFFANAPTFITNQTLVKNAVDLTKGY